MDQAQKSLLKRSVKLTALLLILAGALSAAALLFFVASGWAIYSIAGPSMEPTLSNGDSVILKKTATPAKGELIFFPKPENWEDGAIAAEEKSKILVKRIAALPGDTLSFDGSKFTVNGRTSFRLDAYTCAKGPTPYRHTLEEGELFVLGDNAAESLDSRRVFCDGASSFYVDPTTAVAHGKVLLKF